tara:strand:+ start:1737 stop:2024 length:288 start_codon:yes stop_codon:yes gene_type:complete
VKTVGPPPQSADVCDLLHALQSGSVQLLHTNQLAPSVLLQALHAVDIATFNTWHDRSGGKVASAVAVNILCGAYKKTIKHYCLRILPTAAFIFTQ